MTAEFLPRPEMPAGELPPPMELEVGVGLTTPPDAAGRFWAVLQITDGTTTSQFRLPWQTAGAKGQEIAAKMAAAQAKGRALTGPRLWTPDQMPPGMLPPDGRPPG